jgi:AraC-like DNA-binding protein
LGKLFIHLHGIIYSIGVIVASVSLLLIGYSLFAALVLAITHFRPGNYADHPTARWAGLVLLLTLCLLQVVHWGWLYLDRPWVQSFFYKIALFAVAPSFYIFSRPLIGPYQLGVTPGTFVWHMVPVMIASFLPSRVAMPLAFIVGAGYLVWLGWHLYCLRHERESFVTEIRLLGTVFAIAVAVSLFGVFRPSPEGKAFFEVYSLAIGLAFLLVQLALGLRPELKAEVEEVAKAAYANSTLNHLDCDKLLNRLAQLMESEAVYRDPELDLASLACRLDVTSHQLSELLNGRLGNGFSRYLRECRVRAAKAMLCQEPNASVLSVGLSVGFATQSNFYEAFRDIEGMTPGQFRKLNISQLSDNQP